MIDLLNLQPNKVSTDLTQYPMTLLALTGHGKTTTLKKMLESFSTDGRKPLFLMFEDRYQGIPNIMAVRIHDMMELQQVLIQLRSNPKLKEIYSCVVIDTVQKFEAMAIRYTCQTKSVEILDDIGAYGKGTKYYRNNLQILEDIKNVGLPVHYLAQADEVTDKDGNTKFIIKMADKNTYKMITQDSYMIGYLDSAEDDDGKLDWFLTFKKSDMLPDLKDTWGVPDKIRYSEAKEIFTEAIEAIGEDNLTNEKTMFTGDKENKKVSFDELMNKGLTLGKLLFDNDRGAEADSVIRNNIGVDEDGNTLRFGSLIEAQRDVAEVVVLKLEELAKKYGLI